MADFDFLETAEASNSQIRSMVVPKSFYIAAGNGVVDCFRSATNWFNATGAIANFNLTPFTSQPRTMQPATSGRQQTE